jgi:two-component system chemotaxis response regulator CheY
MRILVVEDDFTSRTLIQKIFSQYGDCDIAVDGAEAIKAFKIALEEEKPYDLICLDIMMPNVDGQQALRAIRDMEKQEGVEAEDQVKVIMTTAVDDPKDVVESIYWGNASSYIVKPIDKKKIVEEARKLGVLN